VTSSVKSWKTYRLGDLAQYINGKAFKPEEWKTTGLPIIRIQNLTDADKPFNYCDQEVDQRYLVNDGDLLISWSATLGSFIWNRGPSVLNQHIFKALPNENLVKKEFLHFLMLNTLDEMAEHTHGIAMKHITKGKFEAIEVSIPNLSEQRRIVSRIKECMERTDEIQSLHESSLKDQLHLSASVIESELHPSFAKEARWQHLSIDRLVTATRNGRSISQDVDGRANGSVLTLTSVRDVTLSTEYKKPIELPEAVASQFSIGEGRVRLASQHHRTCWIISSC